MQYREVCKYTVVIHASKCVVYCIALYVLIRQISTFNLVAASHTVYMYLRVGFTVQLSSLTVQLQSLIVQLYQASLHIVTDQLKLS